MFGCYFCGPSVPTSQAVPAAPSVCAPAVSAAAAATAVAAAGVARLLLPGPSFRELRQGFSSFHGDLRLLRLFCWLLLAFAGLLALYLKILPPSRAPTHPQRLHSASIAASSQYRLQYVKLARQPTLGLQLNFISLSLLSDP